MRLILIPFAGGSQFSFNGFVSAAYSKGVKPVVAEYPGRGKRFSEPLLLDIHQIAEDVFNQVKDQLIQPYIIYGHSMGCIAGYLLVQKIIERGLPLPQHLFVSGCGGPSGELRDDKKHLLRDDAFIEKLKELGGCPPEILEDPQLLNIFLPIIRSDFQAVESYVYEPPDKVPEIPISVIIGTLDKVTIEDAQLWQKETTIPIEVMKFEGNHFFVFGNEGKIVNIIYRSYKINSYM